MSRVWKRWLSRPRRPRLVFAPRAWLKLQYLCHAGPTEVGGFGLSAPTNCLYIEDFFTIRQRATPTNVRFDDEALADYFDQGVDRGLPVEQFARVWIHTHPGASAVPTPTDWETFARAFGGCAWAVMAILSRTGQTTAHLRTTTGPALTVALPAVVDWSVTTTWLDGTAPAMADDIARWRQEYQQNIFVEPELPVTARVDLHAATTPPSAAWSSAWHNPPHQEVTNDRCDNFCH